MLIRSVKIHNLEITNKENGMLNLLRQKNISRNCIALQQDSYEHKNNNRKYPLPGSEHFRSPPDRLSLLAADTWSHTKVSKMLKARK